MVSEIVARERGVTCTTSVQLNAQAGNHGIHADIDHSSPVGSIWQMSSQVQMQYGVPMRAAINTSQNVK